jgi:hypothetical protein
MQLEYIWAKESSNNSDATDRSSKQEVISGCGIYCAVISSEMESLRYDKSYQRPPHPSDLALLGIRFWGGYDGGGAGGGHRQLGITSGDKR